LQQVLKDATVAAVGAALTEKQSARRQRVIKAAMTLAAEGGYEAVQMRDVASKARVALGTLYRYFSSKDQLLVATLGQWAGELQHRLTQRPPRGETPADRVVEVLRRATRALESEPRLSAALVTALTNLSSDDPGALEYAQAVYRTIGEVVTNAMDHDEVPEREQIITVIAHVWLSVLVAWVRGWGPPGQMAADLETATRLMLDQNRSVLQAAGR
jgi:TetR/AcrR family transcriptional regulator, cholesterol catabolism regulator